MIVSRNWHEFEYRVRRCVGSPLWCCFTVALSGLLALAMMPVTGHPILTLCITFVCEVLVLTVVGGLVGGITHDAIDRGELVLGREERS